MKNRIAVITGGNSSEKQISIKSAETIIENIDTENFTPYKVVINKASWVVETTQGENIEINKDDFSFIENGVVVNFDLALIMIHGNPGEDGKLQGYLDMIGVPYTSSSVLTSSATFSKHFTKQYLQSYGILSADWVLLNKRLGYNLDEVQSEIMYPCFVKPNNAGSSFGVSKVNTPEQLVDAIEKAMEEDGEVLVEKMLNGTEITCGVLRTSKKAYVFPVTEIVSKNGFFDYEAKYTEGLAEEIVPARIAPEVAKKCQDLSLKIYDLFNCKWFARIDYILQDGELFLLEINTIPGMTAESIVPKMLRAEGVELSGLLGEILNDELVL